jgi:acetyl esterase/lipase
MATEQPNWIEGIAGRPVEEMKPLESVEDVIAARAYFATVFDREPAPLPEGVTLEHVVLRERDGRQLRAEVCALSAGGRDAAYALRRVARNASRHGGDAERTVVAGSSAGANIGAAATLAVLPGGPAVDGGDLEGVDVRLSAALLLYGVYDFRTLTTEPGEYANLVEIPGLPRPHFLSRHFDPLVSPRHAENLDRFPPTYLACGARDTLLTQTLDFAKALVDAAVSTTVSIVADVDHFIRIRPRPAQVADEVERMAAWLAERTA